MTTLIKYLLFSFFNLYFLNVMAQSTDIKIAGDEAIIYTKSNVDPIFIVQAVPSFECQKMGKLNISGKPEFILSKYYQTGVSGSMLEHFNTLKRDGTRESAEREIKSSDGLKSAFKNLVEAKCNYTIKLKNATIYRITQTVQFDRPVDIKLTLVESCNDAGKNCRLTNKFYRSQGVEAFMKILDAYDSSKVMTIVTPPILFKATSIQTRFLMLKDERSADFKIRLMASNFDCEMNLKIPKNLEKLRNTSETATFLRHATKDKLPVKQIRDAFIQDIDLKEPFTSVKRLSFSEYFSNSNIVAINSKVNFQDSIQFLSLKCIQKICEFDELDRNSSLDFLASITAE